MSCALIEVDVRFACLTKSGEGIGQNEVSYWLTPHQQLHTLDDNGFWKRLLWCDKDELLVLASRESQAGRLAASGSSGRSQPVLTPVPPPVPPQEEPLESLEA